MSSAVNLHVTGSIIHQHSIHVVFSLDVAALAGQGQGCGVAVAAAFVRQHWNGRRIRTRGPQFDGNFGRKRWEKAKSIIS